MIAWQRVPRRGSAASYWTGADGKFVIWHRKVGPRSRNQREAVLFKSVGCDGYQVGAFAHLSEAKIAAERLSRSL